MPPRPKVSVFKYAKRNKSAAAYIDRARVLKKKYGVQFGFPLTEKLTPQRRAAVTKKVRQLAGYLNPENGFEFVPVSGPKLRKLKRKGQVGAKAYTPKGVFIQKPKGKGKQSIKISDTGELEIRTGRRISTFALYDSADIVKDPRQVIADAKKRGATDVLIRINAYASSSTYDLASFEHYLNSTIVPDIEEAWENPEKKSAFRNTFGVEFVKFSAASGGLKKRRQKPNQNETKRTDKARPRGKRKTR